MQPRKANISLFHNLMIYGLLSSFSSSSSQKSSRSVWKAKRITWCRDMERGNMENGFLQTLFAIKLDLSLGSMVFYHKTSQMKGCGVLAAYFLRLFRWLPIDLKQCMNVRTAHNSHNSNKLFHGFEPQLYAKTKAIGPSTKSSVKLL